MSSHTGGHDPYPLTHILGEKSCQLCHVLRLCTRQPPKPRVLGQSRIVYNPTIQETHLIIFNRAVCMRTGLQICSHSCKANTTKGVVCVKCSGFLVRKLSFARVLPRNSVRTSIQARRPAAFFACGLSRHMIHGADSTCGACTSTPAALSQVPDPHFLQKSMQAGTCHRVVMRK